MLRIATASFFSLGILFLLLGMIPANEPGGGDGSFRLQMATVFMLAAIVTAVLYRGEKK
ncbi:hypothetical protein [Planotetraspora silvatica]|nr:hypothetical protein [Planotetraspora silvatica]